MIRVCEEAIAAYDTMLQINPTDVYAWNNKENVLYNQDKYDQAILAYDKALQIDPGCAEARENRAIVLRVRDEHSGFLGALSGILQKIPFLTATVQDQNNSGIPGQG